MNENLHINITKIYPTTFKLLGDALEKSVKKIEENTSINILASSNYLVELPRVWNRRFGNNNQGYRCKFFKVSIKTDIWSMPRPVCTWSWKEILCFDLHHGENNFHRNALKYEAHFSEAFKKIGLQFAGVFKTKHRRFGHDKCYTIQKIPSMLVGLALLRSHP